MHCKLTFSPITFVHPDRLSSLRGNPSIRKLFLSLLVMARSSREQVISTGTMVPLVMWCSINSPYREPGLALSALSKSPADKCTWPNCSTILAHWVPFPAPGPPKTKITLGKPMTRLLKQLLYNFSTLGSLSSSRPSQDKNHIRQAHDKAPE